MIALGAFIDGFPKTAPASAIDEYGALVGTPPRIVMWYEGDPKAGFNQAAADAVIYRCARPVVSYSPWGCDCHSIVAGTYDAQLHAYFAAIAKWGKRLYLRPMWEMNGGWYAWGFGKGSPPQTASDLIAAWRHIVAIARAEGAGNIRFVWCPDRGQQYVPYAAIYPGDEWVDWLGIDTYNFGAANWAGFHDRTMPAYAAITALSRKPLMIGEMASSETGGDKAAWISAAATEMLVAMPRIKAAVWFHINKEADWRVNSSPAALLAYRVLAADKAFMGKMP